MDFYDFPYIGNNHPNWLYNMFHYFFQGLKPTTSLGFYHLKFKGIYLINDAWLIGMLPNILVLILDGNLKELKTWFLILSYTVTCINTTFTTWLGPWMYSSCSLIPDDSCVSFITLRWHKKKGWKIHDGSMIFPAHIKFGSGFSIFDDPPLSHDTPWDSHGILGKYQHFSWLNLEFKQHFIDTNLYTLFSIIASSQNDFLLA